DIEGGRSDDPDRRRQSVPAEDRRAVRWRADDESEIVGAGDLRPGDTIVVPASYGGVGRGSSWNPQSRLVVTDLATRSQRSRRGRLILRLVPSLVRNPPTPDDLIDGADRVAAWNAQIGEWLASPAVADWLADRSEPTADDAVFEAVAALRIADPELPTVTVDCHRRADGSAFVLEGPWPSPIPDEDEDEDEDEDRSDTVDSEPETSSFIGRTVTLKQHLDDVAEWAGAMAGKCGLPTAMVGDLALAGRLHDLGKADPRFQQLLVDGRAPGDLLAKSDGRRTSAAARRQAQRRAGYPDRARHELLSASLMAHADELKALASDWELVLHLVASHHGHARPAVPVTLDQQPVTVSVPADVAGVEVCGDSDHRLHRIDAGVTERFWSLNERYGWYGLAWLEAILRLADHRASAERQGGGRHG
ncbi:MAG: CRISPR-associated endonuclease Cas3'', partial [Acidimicrobiales bacterium]